MRGLNQGGKRRGLGLGNDALITCKRVTLHYGQQIIAVFSQSKYFRSKKWASRGNNSIVEKIISWLFVFLAYHICPLVLKFLLQNASDGHCDRAFLTKNKACWTIDPVYRLHRFCHVRTWEDYRSYDAHKKFLDKVSLKFIGSKSFQESFINTIVELYTPWINRFTLHNNSIPW